ncbi:MAG: hypothetical protein AB7K24_29180 [Gemmataceae bacterium]
MNRTTLLASASLILLAAPGNFTRAADPKPKAEEVIAGKSEVLRAYPKRFARLLAVDPARRQATLLIEKEELAKVWNISPDAEIKIAGHWGRLDQLPLNGRVWAWFQLDRDKQPAAIQMLADELSEQDMMGGVTLEARGENELKISSLREGQRTLQPTKDLVAQRGDKKVDLNAFKPGERVYVQTNGKEASLVLDPAAFAVRQAEQAARLRKEWLTDGLPGRVLFTHVTGELEYLLDHEAMRWGRALQPGTKVSLQTAKPIQAVVKQVAPWRERTLVRLVMRGFDQADLSPGQRVPLLVPAPSKQVEDDPLPPDRGKDLPRAERIEWFLASIYCTCKVKGDGCTGHFYTLASCNPNACGMPNKMRRALGDLIDKKLTDEQIFEALRKDHGPDLLRPHLLP